MSKERKEEKELEIVVKGELDFRKFPKEVFEAFIVALEEDICEWVKERSN